MTDYKLVPVEPTPEMVGAAEDAYMPFGDMELAVRMAVLAAPAVQWEPVGEVRLELGAQPYVFAELYSESPSVLAPGTKLYAAPQPAEQQPASDVSALVEALVAILEHDSPINIVDTATETERDIFDIARAALAAHRKQKESSHDNQ